ncbi:hypothetical protein NQ315_017578 [Exocentrus adspersus]|uniref:Transposase n=1 Tax=Exocentrus adspersus TaxID=1586481 RepID=A0AAV8VIB0_9CUCU|nr:hypothetical protein NQ315_017578 [Exocentrus adspersus]
MSSKTVKTDKYYKRARRNVDSFTKTVFNPVDVGYSVGENSNNTQDFPEFNSTFPSALPADNNNVTSEMENCNISFACNSGDVMMNQCADVRILGTTLGNAEAAPTNSNHLPSQLTEWAVKHNITHTALTDLLKILKLNHADLPTDARTLLQTPRKVKLIPVHPGEYCHFGIKNCLEKLLSCIPDGLNLNTLEICINVDGLPLSKSSGSQFYPILCSIFQNKKYVDVVGIYHGYEKPVNANVFLNEFVQEAIELVTNGFIYKNKSYFVKFKAFICDAPAKSYITFTKSHTAYNSCTKCHAEGDYVSNRICFPITNNIQKRTDSDFRQRLQEEHHTVEFNRKPRSVNEAKRWKATEFRQFLFYTGPVVLKTVLNTFAELYGKEYISHNIHNLLHIIDDVRNFGPLDMFSAFPFENYMQSLKKLIRKSDKPLQQIIRRKAEIDYVDINIKSQTTYPQAQMEHTNGPLICNVSFLSQYGKIILSDKFTLKTEDFYDNPCKSSELGIYLVENPGPIHCWKLEEVAYKIEMETPTWTVVKFVKENSVEAVPTSWLLGNNKCYWPPYTKDKVLCAIRKHMVPNTCWPLHNIETFRNSTFGIGYKVLTRSKGVKIRDDYALARKKSRKAEDTSDLNSDVEVVRKRKQKIISSSESETSFENSSDDIKQPPKITKRSSVASSAIGDVTQQEAPNTVIHTAGVSKYVNENIPSNDLTPTTVSQNNYSVEMETIGGDIHRLTSTYILYL